MKAQKPHQLSQAQTYYLHVLGVDLYGLKDDEESFDTPETSRTTHPDTNPISHVKASASSPASSLEAVKLKLQSKSKPQDQPQPQLQPQAPVVLMSEQAFKQSKLVADLCILHGVTLDEVKKLGDDYFQVGAVQWKFVERVDRAAVSAKDSEAGLGFKFANNKLVSEPVSELTNVKTKRALWSAFMSIMK